MPSPYQQLRQAVACLAAPAEEQIRYLDQAFKPLSVGWSAAGYGNDELALNLHDAFLAGNHMIEQGHLTVAEMNAVQPLDELLSRWSGQENVDFWRREALIYDVRWEEVRACAARTLAKLPDEERAISRSA